MKKLIAYVKPYKLDKIIQALRIKGVEEIFVEEIKEFTIKDTLKLKMLPCFKIQLVVKNENVRMIYEIIAGEILSLDAEEIDFEVSELVEIVDIRTGERNILVNQFNNGLLNQKPNKQ